MKYELRCYRYIDTSRYDVIGHTPYADCASVFARAHVEHRRWPVEVWEDGERVERFEIGKTTVEAIVRAS